MRTPFVVPPLLWLSCCLGVTPAAAAPNMPTTLEDVVVTATRTAQTVDETLAAVTVIGREKIERSGLQSLPDLLDGLAGISVVRNGGYGSTSSLLLRGTNAGHVLVLVDGFKVGSATLGLYSWEHIPPALVERIEVVRGPRSSLYGSEAIGGVVQIFTRKPNKTGITAHLEGGLGSQGIQQTSAALSGGDGTHFFYLAASRFATEGINAITVPPGQTPEPDEDGYRNLSFSARLGRRFSNGEVEMTWMRATGENDLDDLFTAANDTSETEQQVAGVKLNLALMPALDLTATGSLVKDEQASFSGGQPTDVFATRSHLLGVQGDFRLTEDHILTSGVDFRREKVSGAAYLVSQRDLTGVFAQYQAFLDKQDLQVGLRWDDVEAIDTRTTYNLAWGYALPRNMRVTASHGTGFKAPTFNDLYWPDAGDPSLVPEKSVHWELGLGGEWDGWGWSVRGFQTRIRDLINWAPAPTDAEPWRWAVGNIDTAQIRGVETTLEGDWQGWAVGMTASWMDPEDSQTGKRLIGRPARLFKLDLDYPVTDAVRMGATWHLQDRRFNDAANGQPVPGFGVVDLRSEYVFSRSWVAKASLKNVMDHDYQTARTFNALGRTFLMTLGWRGDFL